MNISLGSLDSNTEVKIVGLGWISDDGIGTNLLTTIGSSFPHVTRQGSFLLSFRGTPYFSNRIALLWHNAKISENPGHNIIFKNAGHKNYFEVEKDGQNI